MQLQIAQQDSKDALRMGSNDDARSFAVNPHALVLPLLWNAAAPRVQGVPEENRSSTQRLSLSICERTFQGHTRRSAYLLAKGCKRILDVFVAFVGLALSMPLCALLAVMIKVDSRGPVFYRSERIGKYGRRFACYKLRTMTADAEARRQDLDHLNERDGVLFKIANDPRVTRMGRLLRKYSLDELPQFWNVLRGEMSIVGPRPSLWSEVEQYSYEDRIRLQATPGITGLWQVVARRDPCFRRYISLDTQYVRHWSLSLDLKILLRTVGVVLAGTGS